MTKSAAAIKVYLEVGSKRVFAGAIDWPGWCRSGRDEASALQALLDYGPRYAKALRASKLGFQAPGDVSSFRIAERLKGDATTDFGAPGKAPAADSRPVTDADLRRFQSLFRACWRAFDAAAVAARGKKLRKGPRGGGRELDAIVLHVLGADGGYLTSLGWKLRIEQGNGPAKEMARARQEILEALEFAVRHGVPERGPRGGRRWSPRYFVRRAAWHVLDHAWEIEDRIG